MKILVIKRDKIGDALGDLPDIREKWFARDKAKKNEEQCTMLTKIQVDILRLKAQKTVELADKAGGVQALQTYENAGTQYLELYRKYCKGPIDAGQPPQAEKCDELVYNAAKSFQAGRLIAKSIAARMILIDPANKMDKSPLAKKSVYEIGGNYQAIAVYDKAAEWYEKYATDKSAENLATLKALGFEVVLDPKSAKLIIGRLSIEKLEALADLNFIRYVAPQALE